MTHADNALVRAHERLFDQVAESIDQREELLSTTGANYSDNAWVLKPDKGCV